MRQKQGVRQELLVGCSEGTGGTVSETCRSYIHALSPANLQSSFRKSGIYPYNPSAVDEINFKPSVALKSCQR
ncbi:hypothetical protein KUTeg_012204 [Tegillarca granosa]|uniref:Uncharacterized protein n=1 Tax=Tegillarca granosa TaxID=220873 RepID=A0ABQ9EYU6_TEGGR|nr:hypothetical protein KUTeg_012204 [Tegillarca granosa]